MRYAVLVDFVGFVAFVVIHERKKTAAGPAEPTAAVSFSLSFAQRLRLSRATAPSPRIESVIGSGTTVNSTQSPETATDP